MNIACKHHCVRVGSWRVEGLKFNVDVTEDVELHKGINAAIEKQHCFISRPKLNDRYGP
jgi:hypothetical protein